MSKDVVVQPAQASSFSPPAHGILQRKCACGMHTMGGECESCRNNNLSLRWKTHDLALGAQHSDEIPPIIHEVLRSPGQLPDTAPHTFFEPRMGHDFSLVKSSNNDIGSPPHPIQHSREVPLPMPLDVREGQMTPHLQQIISGLGPGDLMPDAIQRLRQDVPGDTTKGSSDLIRVHDNHQSHITAALFDSEAFTVGNHIVLGDARHSQTSRSWLVAHEVAHTIQQHPQGAGHSYAESEREADMFADQAIGLTANHQPILPYLTPVSTGLARRVIWKAIQDLPGDLLLIIDVDDGDFVGGCVRAVVPHAGIKLIKKHPHAQLFNLHVGFLINAAGEYCIFFYESVTGICEMKCFPSKEALEEAWDEITDWLADMLKKVFEALAILALILAAAVLAYLIAQAIAAALAAGLLVFA